MPDSFEKIEQFFTNLQNCKNDSLTFCCERLKSGKKKKKKNCPDTQPFFPLSVIKIQTTNYETPTRTLSLWIPSIIKLINPLSWVANIIIKWKTHWNAMHFYYTNSLTPQPQHYIWPKPSNFQKFIDILRAKSCAIMKGLEESML